MASPPQIGLSLCAGGGGLDMGVELACPGFATACFVEWEEYPRASLIAAQQAGYFAGAPIWSDVKQFSGRPWRGIVDTVLAGYPCQPFSAAGQRKGADDPRHLWPDIERIIDECDPTWVILENVAGHLSLGLDTVLRALWGMGFTPAAGLFTAEETGAPHERARVFIVAYRPRQRTRKPDNQISAEPRADARQGVGGGGRRLHGELGNPGPDADPRGMDLGTDRGSASQGKGEGTERQRVRDRAGSASDDVDHPASPRRQPEGVRPEADSEGGQRLPGAGRDELADAGGGTGHEGRAGFGGGRFGAIQPGEAISACGSRPVIHPPGPGDMGAWSYILDCYPEGAPALSLRDLYTVSHGFAQAVETGELCEREAESRLRRMAHGMATRARALRLLGNGVHPLAAAYAVRTLCAAHGLGRVDMERAGDGEPTGATGSVRVRAAV